MKNPLRKRILRMLRTDWKKYLVLFLLLTITIGFISGMFVANDSMMATLEEAYEKYQIEDGHFELKDRATEELLAAFEGEGISIYEQFYKDLEEDADLDGVTDATVRVFWMREELNRASLHEGVFPEAEDEIAIDRMHADNSGVSVGDTIALNGRRMKVTGLVALSDYNTLYENNADLMFDALTFDIAVVTREAYNAMRAPETAQYAFRYDDRPETTAEQSRRSEALVKQLAILAATGGLTDDEDEAKELEENVKEWTDFLEDIQAQADELEARRDALQGRADALSERGEALQERMALMTPEEQFSAMEELQAESEAIRAEGDALAAEAEELQKDADALSAREDEIQTVVDQLEALEPYEEHQNELTDYVPEYANQALHFAPDDMGSDKVMAGVLLYILVAVLAFIFAITVSNTITSEAAVIGTLRASGYTRGELLRHYTALPVLVTLLAALVGNILGYSCFKSVAVAMYYNSYSLPTYVTLWNMDGFFSTTVWPVLLMLLINLLIVHQKLKLEPLKFLRRDLGRSKRKKAVRLPQWSFFARFRLRVLFQNAPDYLVLFFGIFFVMVLLVFSIGMPATLDNYMEEAADFAIAEYQYVLKSTEDADGNPVETADADAEKYSMTGLLTTDGVHIGEELSVYGYEADSVYFDLPGDLAAGRVYISNAYADKFGLKAGQEITLKEKYLDDTYDFTIEGVYTLPGAMAVLMPNDAFNEVFARDEGSFTGFLSERELEDLDEENIAGIITVADALKIAKQLDHSMGDYMDYFAVICIFLAMLLMYLLTKLIVEKNQVSISMLKVLGYTSGEVNRLYVLLTSAVVVLSVLLTASLSLAAVELVWKQIMYDLSGWFIFYIGFSDIVKAFAYVLVAYIVVAAADMRRIRRILLTEALKNAE